MKPDEDFTYSTVQVTGSISDMSALYARFLFWIPTGGYLLDAGCGSGRDARAFLERGYRVAAFDASPTLARLASVYCRLPVRVLRLQEIAWCDSFDGIWACASLLHVPASELPGVLGRLAVALKPGGVLYTSFKYGRGEREQGNRHFTDLDEAGLATLLRAVPCLAEREIWVTADRRPGREAERWLNSLLQRAA